MQSLAACLLKMLFTIVWLYKSSCSTEMKNYEFTAREKNIFWEINSVSRYMGKSSPLYPRCELQ